MKSPVSPNSPIRSTAQLAQLLGLSRWTVSRALNGHPGIHPETAERVREAARREGFAPNILGRGLRAGRTDLIGVCLPDLEDYFLAAKISRLQEAVVAQGLQPLMQITRSEASESAALERFAAMRCGAVVLIASRLPDGHPALRHLAASGIQRVFIDPLHGQSDAVVATDRALAMRHALGYLHELGHRGVAVAGINPAHPYGRQRERGLRQACRKCGWDFSRQVVFLNRAEDLEDSHLGQKLAEDYLREHYPARRAIIALNDRIALGMMQRILKAGLRIPGDVSILGYDDAAFAEVVSP
ncbi:MAG TPA: LacI family DNA-binding transcriptional regulator, partial [Chthoniobacterales bacterium]